MAEEELADAPDFGLDAYTPDADAGEFVMLIAHEGERTLDGRQFAVDAIDWREPPLPLLFKDTNGDGHKDGRIGGVIHEIWKDDDGKVFGRGFFGSHPDGQLLRKMVGEGVLSGVSADVGGAQVVTLADDEGVETRHISKGTIMGVTAIALPAFNDTRIAITASADMPVTSEPPAAWFENPKLDKPTPLTVTADGQVYGHAALWGTCHVGMRNQCVTPPKSRSGYAYFNVGQVLTADVVPVAAGVITMDTGHAGVALSAEESKKHYDDTGAVIAHVRTGEDEHGIWFAGSINPRATRDQVATFRGASVSGDWRSVGGSLEMVGLLAVNTPGFPIPRAQAGLTASAEEETPTSLVAANIVEDCGCGDTSLSASGGISAPASTLEARFLDARARRAARR